jgi:hypothetical protein
MKYLVNNTHKAIVVSNIVIVHWHLYLQGLHVPELQVYLTDPPQY